MAIMRRRTFVLSAAALAADPRGALAQTPGLARILCGFPAGGTADTTSRRVAETWRGRLAENVLVENRVGAAGRIAINAVKDAAADGTMVLLSPDSMMTIYPSVYRRLGYDPARDLAAVSPVCRYTFALGIGPAVPAEVTTLAAYVAWAKANAATVAYGSPAAGSMPHFLGDRFYREIGVPARHTPYRGSAPALQDLVGGHVTSVMTVLGDFLPFKDSAGLRVLAVSDRDRSRFLPGVPTFAEAGLPGVFGVENYGIFLPGRASPDLVARVQALVAETAALRAVTEGLAVIGLETGASSAEAYRDYLAQERVAWAPIVKESGFTLEE
jgi:tripartite-type tricarboxylate transporter receptor subunit TctC